MLYKGQEQERNLGLFAQVANAVQCVLVLVHSVCLSSQ